MWCTSQHKLIVKEFRPQIDKSSPQNETKFSREVHPSIRYPIAFLSTHLHLFPPGQLSGQSTAVHSRDTGALNSSTFVTWSWRENAADLYPFFYLSPFLRSFSWLAAEMERCHATACIHACVRACSFVFSRRPLRITFGFKEASRGVRVGMHEIRDGTTKESPFRIVEDVAARSRTPSSLSRW